MAHSAERESASTRDQKSDTGPTHRPWHGQCARQMIGESSEKGLAMCTVLLAYASRMGATREIAEVLADELRQTDHAVKIISCATAPEADEFDAVVIGSALYTGRWMPEASRYLRRQAPRLTNRPTFLFQSGPCDTGRDSATPTAVPHTVGRTVRRFGLPEPITFAGRLDPTRATGRMSRWMADALPAGDFRDWTAIRAWGYSIGVELYEFLDRRPQPPHVHCQPVGFHSR